jgi:uncharacterized membrane protein YeaQ/YmgE (transglycosylase-associated protein family)
MAILAFIVFGFFIGLLARALMPGKQQIGILLTAGLGCAGSVLGGFLGNLLAGRPLMVLSTAGFFGSLIGALLLLMLVAPMTRRRRTMV